jgi:hypothetical protein
MVKEVQNPGENAAFYGLRRNDYLCECFKGEDGLCK